MVPLPLLLGYREFVLFDPVHGHRAKMLEPPATCCPGRTTISASRGNQISTRDPKRIMPTRSPSVTVSPSAFQQSTRRAIHPAICFKTISPRSVKVNHVLLVFRRGPRAHGCEEA